MCIWFPAANEAWNESGLAKSKSPFAGHRFAPERQALLLILRHWWLCRCAAICEVAPCRWAHCCAQPSIPRGPKA